MNMTPPLTTTGVPSDAGAWQELEDVFAGLGQLARSPITPEQFYRTLLEESIRALSASGGAVWLRAASGAFQPAVQAHWPAEDFARNDRARRAHEALLADAASGGRVVTIAPQSTRDAADSGNPTGQALVLAPVKSLADGTPGTLDSATLAIIELLIRADASPATYRGCEQFLAAVSELAADFHTFDELRRLRQGDGGRNALIQLGMQVHRQLDLSETAYTVANEGRRVVGCDRLSVLVARGRRCRLLATSSVSRIERRSGAARRLEELAEHVRRTDEPAYYGDGGSDAMPQIAAALEQHAEESHARQIAAIPLHRPTEPNADDRVGSVAGKQHRTDTPQFVLVAEQFDARNGDLCRERLVEVGQVCATALENSLEIDRLPLGWLWRSLGAAKEQVTAHLPRSVVLLAAAVAAAVALVIVPADFNIEAPGTLEPVVRRDVFAPRSGLVDEVLVQHGANVAAGQPLVRLRDPQLDLELKRVHGEIATAQKQIDAVRATRTNRAVRDANPADAYRLSAEERELDQQLINLRSELELLNKERDTLVVTSPIAGNVLTWDVAHRLVKRPVERGEVLVTVADLTGDWQLELDVPDDRLGHVLAAQQELRPDLSVRFRLSSDDREQHTGRLAEVCRTADVAAEPGGSPSPTVLVKVALDPLQLTDAARAELRPGVSARGQIACGRRSVGYVWLHDIWDAAVEWLRF
jgi:multidrug efflux pump subunit AcrA (membrane-fusion protein)